MLWRKDKGASAPRKTEGDKFEVAAECFPAHGITIKVRVPEWGEPLSCRTGATEPENQIVLLGLPQDIRWRPSAKKGTSIRLSWADHSEWHECNGEFAQDLREGGAFMRIKLTTAVFHHERRKFVRARRTRPIFMIVGQRTVQAKTVDLSEAAARVLVSAHDPPYEGDHVHISLTLSSHLHTSSSLDCDATVIRQEILEGRQAGSKYVVLRWDSLTPAQQDQLRGVIFDVDLEDRKPSTTESV